MLSSRQQLLLDIQQRDQELSSAQDQVNLGHFAFHRLFCLVWENELSLYTKMFVNLMAMSSGLVLSIRRLMHSYYLNLDPPSS